MRVPSPPAQHVRSLHRLRNVATSQRCKEILETILERHLWTLTDCKTPEQTLYGSIFREINTKEHPRIAKSNVKGKFVIAE